MGSKKFRPKPISLAAQDAALRATYPSFRLVTASPSLYVWNGTIQPAPLCALYTIEIKYQINDVPEVRVLDPVLRKREKSDEAIPHLYPGMRLCLYLPWAGEWHRGMHLSQTIVPWTSLWLFYYEAWHATGRWLGGGIHPQGRRMREVA